MRGGTARLIRGWDRLSVLCERLQHIKKKKKKQAGGRHVRVFIAYQAALSNRLQFHLLGVQRGVGRFGRLAEYTVKACRMWKALKDFRISGG